MLDLFRSMSFTSPWNVTWLRGAHPLFVEDFMVFRSRGQAIHVTMLVPGCVFNSRLHGTGIDSDHATHWTHWT